MFRVQSAIRPTLSERENGANGTLDIWLGGATTDESGGPHPSGLNGTESTLKLAMVSAVGFEMKVCFGELGFICGCVTVMGRNERETLVLLISSVLGLQ